MIQVTTAQFVAAMIGAAGLGSLLSFIFSLIGQALERRSRIREMLISKAVEMAEKDAELQLETAKHTSDKKFFFSPLLYARWYHYQLNSLFKSGTISPEEEKKFEVYFPEFSRDKARYKALFHR